MLISLHIFKTSIQIIFYASRYYKARGNLGLGGLRTLALDYLPSHYTVLLILAIALVGIFIYLKRFKRYLFMPELSYLSS